MASDIMQPTDSPSPKRSIGAAAYVVAGLSFIPLVGVAFGLIGLIWAAASRRAGRLIVGVISFCGIGATVGIYSWLFYQTTNPSGPYAPLSAELAQTLLVENVKAIEFYKLKTGSYPATLAEIQTRFPDAGMVAVADPSAAFRSAGSDFYYARISDTAYDLRGVGPDGRAFTEDDLFPDLGAGPHGQIGLVAPGTRAFSDQSASYPAALK